VSACGKQLPTHVLGDVQEGDVSLVVMTGISGPWKRGLVWALDRDDGDDEWDYHGNSGH
jgi:hypothetical protein